MSKRIDIQPATVKKPLVEQPLRVAAYCRVSTDSKEQLGSLENQIEFYTNYIRKQINWTLAGIYSDNASGVRIKKRIGYQQMMRDCKHGKIDLVLAKSISRFGRDTLTTIKDIRRLKKMNIGVYFEVGGFNTLTTGDSVIDQYATLAQAESQSHSENVKFGMRRRMESGRALLNHTQFLGYTKGPDGELKVVPEEAEIVRKIFELYLQGNGVRKIKRYLEEHGIKTVTGKAEWSTSTIDRMLSNEKYIGQVLMQKTYTPDFLTGKQVKNKGQLAMYLVEDAHEPIIDRETFEKVQRMKGQLKKQEPCGKVKVTQTMIL
ncbi:recombinase family protein [Intestinibacillus massiliensis]|nr:recombinase family protein [Intestinibacillus massiliensis]